MTLQKGDFFYPNSFDAFYRNARVIGDLLPSQLGALLTEEYHKDTLMQVNAVLDESVIVASFAGSASRQKQGYFLLLTNKCTLKLRPPFKEGDVVKLIARPADMDPTWTNTVVVGIKADVVGVLFEKIRVRFHETFKDSSGAEITQRTQMIFCMADKLFAPIQQYGIGDKVELVMNIMGAFRDDDSVVARPLVAGTEVEIVGFGDQTTIVEVKDPYGKLHILQLSSEWVRPKKEKVSITAPVTTESFAYSYYSLKEGRNRPGTIILQQAINELRRINDIFGISTPLKADGNFGPKTKKVVQEVQRHLGFVGDAVDGVVGKGTWSRLVPKLGDWRPSLRLRIAELENSYENGSNGGFDAHNMVKFEGWPNFGIWNCNFPRKYGGSIEGSSLGFLLKYAGREDLYRYDPHEPEVIAKFLGTKEGVRAQLHTYMDRWIIGPAIRQLRGVGFNFEDGEEETFDKQFYSPFYQRLIALACDIAVNSGPFGFFPKCVPRIWTDYEHRDSLYLWPTDADMPDMQKCIEVFEEVFDCKVADPTQQQSLRVDSRAFYQEALQRCLWRVCTNGEQQINLIAELQARCIPPKPTGGDENLQELVLRRRRSVARVAGYTFQGVRFNMQNHFGIGV